MGIRVKLINNYMSIALNALSAEAAVLCEALGLSFDVALSVMSGTPAGKGHFTTSWPNKVLKGDLTPAFMIDLAHKDLGIALDVANQLHVPMPLGAAFFSPSTSAWVALHEVAKLQPGESVWVTGASGAVGSLVMQLVRDAGGRATAVDPESGPPPAASADLLVDTVGGDVLASALPAVRPGGRAVLIGYTAGPTLALDIAHFLQRDVALLPLNMFRREAAGRAAAPELLARLADGRLQLDLRCFPLADAAAALAWIAQRGHRGRAVLVP